MKRPFMLVASAAAIGVVLFVAGTLGVTKPGRAGQPSLPAGVGVPSGAPRLPAGASLDSEIASLQARLVASPSDHISWATLGLAYVQQAKVTVDPTYYPRADGALARSLDIDRADNFLAYAGLSALASARHRFADARSFAEQGLKINAFSAILYGALSDAELQLGDYTGAFAAVQKMVDLSPDMASLSRASYTWELRGNVDEARRLMQRAYDDAPTAADRAFALVHLGGLSFDAGDANSALRSYLDALAASPNDVSALAGKARAEAALGQIQTSIDDYATVVARAPEPGYLVEYGRVLESAGRGAEAKEQYAVFDVTQRLYAGNGVEPDATETLFEVDRGHVATALADARHGIEIRPFVVMYDAQAWALHAAGRDAEAITAADRALSLGTPSALFHFHAGIISLALGDVHRARRELSMAIEINPVFDPISAKTAADALASLPPETTP